MSVEDGNYSGQRYEWKPVQKSSHKARPTPENTEAWENLTPLARKLLTVPEFVIKQLGEMGLTVEDVFDRRGPTGIHPKYYADPFKAEESDR